MHQCRHNLKNRGNQHETGAEQFGCVDFEARSAGNVTAFLELNVARFSEPKAGGLLAVRLPRRGISSEN
jgi:hypothetical protein